MGALEGTPPDSQPIPWTGASLLTGGGRSWASSNLALREQTGLAIFVADESLNCVASAPARRWNTNASLRHAIDYESDPPLRGTRL